MLVVERHALGRPLGPLEEVGRRAAGRWWFASPRESAGKHFLFVLQLCSKHCPLEVRNTRQPRRDCRRDLVVRQEEAGALQGVAVCEGLLNDVGVDNLLHHNLSDRKVDVEGKDCQGRAVAGEADSHFLAPPLHTNLLGVVVRELLPVLTVWPSSNKEGQTVVLPVQSPEDVHPSRFWVHHAGNIEASLGGGGGKHGWRRETCACGAFMGGRRNLAFIPQGFKDIGWEVEGVWGAWVWRG